MSVCCIAVFAMSNQSMVEQLRLRQNRQRLQVITLLQLVIHHNRKVISHNLLLMAINLLMTKSLKTISRMKKGRR